MSKTINTAEIVNEIVQYGRKVQPQDFAQAIMSTDIILNRYATSLGKVKGAWTFPTVFMGAVVQAFSDKWTAFGDVQFRRKVARNFRQKVNFPINPNDIYGSWLEELHHEDKKPADMPISKYIVSMIADGILADLTNITITGKYDAANVGSATPDPYKSMDGLNAIIDSMSANTVDPIFSIPVDAALANNQVDRVNKFERGLPTNAKVDVIFMELSEFQDYVEQRENLLTQPVNYKEGYRYKTKYGRELVGVPGLKKGRLIAWVAGNLFRLYDRKDNPAQIDDVQTQDYLVKIFIQWTLGYDFAINQYVFVETNDAAKKRGLNNPEQNKLYFPTETNLV